MATATALRFTESIEDQIDDLLMRICAELQLDDTRYDLAESSYKAVLNLLESQPSIALLRPAIYPQGSFLLNTTVKPLGADEYDLDFVCQFVCSPTLFSHPVASLDLIEKALRASDVYRPMVERMNRCIRLNYARKFHMDILPACFDNKMGGTCILIPDRKLADWTASNPKGYSKWLDGRARQVIARRMLEKAEPIPIQEPLERKLPLKLCVQLSKRWRDIRYRSNPDLAPISIVLTTLSAHIYRGEHSIACAMGSILGGISELSRASHPRLKVLNPMNQEEDFSERWDARPQAYREFVNGVTEFEAQWKALLETRGVDKVARALERLFGEELAKRVVESQTRDIEAVRSSNRLGMKTASGIITGVVGPAVIPVPRNTFYGEGE
jgi:hypothetical protein